MTTKRQTPIKLKDVIADSKRVDTMSTYVIDEETKKIVKYNKFFDRTKIEKLIVELFEDMQYTVENKIAFFENDDQLIKYELLLIIKYFSHFNSEIGDKFEDKIFAMEALMKTGLYDLFYEEIFNSLEVADVVEQINKVAERAIFASESIEKAIEKSEETD